MTFTNTSFTCQSTMRTLTTNMKGSGSGSVTGAGSYGVGTPVKLTATPKTDSVFTDWSPSICSDSFVMPSNDLACTANFEKKTVLLSQCTTFNLFEHPQLQIPCIKINGVVYQAGMNLISVSPTLRFEMDLTTMKPSNILATEQCAVFPMQNTLSRLKLNCLSLYTGLDSYTSKYWVEMDVLNNNGSTQFDVVNFGKN